MIDLVRMMVRKVNVPLNEAVAMATENPARAIGVETKGRLLLLRAERGARRLDLGRGLIGTCRPEEHGEDEEDRP